MAKIEKFTDLDVWKESHKLVLEIYQITQKFPKSELYGITNQIRKAVLSVTVNIAEGFSRYHSKEKLYFYYNSRGSIRELQNLFMICQDLHYFDSEQYSKLWSQSEKADKILNGLIFSTRKLAS